MKAGHEARPSFWQVTLCVQRACPLAARLHGSADRDLRPEVEHVPVVHPDAAVRRHGPNYPRLVRAVDEVARRLPAPRTPSPPRPHPVQAHLARPVDAPGIARVLRPDLPGADWGDVAFPVRDRVRAHELVVHDTVELELRILYQLSI